ncbi:MAG: cytochrome c oxidase accessory protein CcoG [Myxococcota bacterium]
MDPTLLDPEEHVLSTLERDGSRRWLKPRLSRGRLLALRRAFAYFLIAAYSLIPYIEVGGQPLILLDLPARRFTIFGLTFLPTDTLLLALAMVGLLLGFFLATALVGRVWCGWACPQTVYMEFLFRPIERLFEGTRGRGGAPRRAPSFLRVAGKYAVYLALAFFLANTFLAYFIGVETLWAWMRASPIDHPVPFLIMALLTGAMMFHFSYFREQLCILACPYGRLQSVLLDERSLIVSYDARRGEPRGKKKNSRSLPVVDEPRGDCVDCGLCVATCPTGIDIRKGLQMECVNCTQCIDACNAVMDKVKRPRGLIRFSSQRADQGRADKRVPRPRVIIYPALLALIAAMFVAVLMGKTTFDAVLLRNAGHPYTTTQGGDIRNMVRLKLTNRGEVAQRYEVRLLEPAGVALSVVDETLELPPRATQTFPISVVAAPKVYIGARGKLELSLQVTADDGDTREVQCSLLGPETLNRPPSGGV